MEAARGALGGTIDLDPASCRAAQRTVRAARWYGEADDGLSQPWHGRVWLNPPYGHGIVGRFAARLAEHLDDGRVAEAVWLSNATLDTRWGQMLARRAAACCHPAGRLRFVPGGGQKAASASQPSVLLYFGPHRERFRRWMAPIGVVMGRMEG